MAEPADITTESDTRAGPARPDRAVVRDALGVGVAVGLSGFAFGVTSADAGLDVLQTCALSLFVFTGASQFALVSALAAGGNPLTAAAGAFFLGVRNAFYGLRLSGLLRLPRSVRPLAAHGVIDESAAVALAQPDQRSARLGFSVTAVSVFALWNLTTLIGALGASALGDTDAWGLDAAGPAVFLALLAPKLSSGVERAVAALGVLLVLACVPVLPAGVPVLVAALAAPVVLAVAGRAAGPVPRTGGAAPGSGAAGETGRPEAVEAGDVAETGKAGTAGKAVKTGGTEKTDEVGKEAR
ncbi:AzlC family ABC transporter permease [Streptomyces sp. NPDC018031]|uniref:AzlC family ABC transporter permease n=1 Tax=Streptomyces sp. NPDC018031 TaxID=3365033 RepID=UPI0037A8BDCE